jgi:hypothetical protein
VYPGPETKCAPSLGPHQILLVGLGGLPSVLEKQCASAGGSIQHLGLLTLWQAGSHWEGPRPTRVSSWRTSHSHLLPCPPCGFSPCRAPREHELPPVLAPLLLRLPQHQPRHLQEAEEGLFRPDRGKAGRVQERPRRTQLEHPVAT